MIGQSTVLILGAGASVDFGFPLGPDLKIQMQSRDPRFNRLIGQGGPSAADLDQFERDLSFSGSSTIDEFLMHRSDLAQVAKMSIAYYVSKHEFDHRLTNSNPPNWFQQLFYKLRLGVNSPAEFARQNALSVVTFNYDRSFERSLWLGLSAIYGKFPQAEVLRAYERVPVVHMHGHLGDLPETAPGNALARARAYRPPESATELVLAAGGIKVISEVASTDKSEFTAARSLISPADNVVILGFGYDETNMKHLGLDTLRPSTKVLACSYGLSPKIEKPLREMLLHRGTNPEFYAKPAGKFMEDALDQLQ